MITVDPNTAPLTVKSWLDTVRPEIDADIDRRLRAGELAGEDDHGRLREAMRYAVLGPGKRLRPALALAACSAVGRPRGDALAAAAAVEMLHAYTLVHDDLPAMDDDTMRRGRPTVHIEFGEATAILAGDGLLTAAFEALADLGPGAADAVAVLARQAGFRGLISGQAIDLVQTAESRSRGFEDLELMHARKTGALFAAAAELGGIAGGASDEQRSALARFGLAVGIAFQHADDRDDGEHHQYSSRARERMHALTSEAAELARSFGEDGRTLLAIATWIGAVA